MEDLLLRVVSCYLENFASYKELSFDFQNQGLTLIQGPTGSGKSTLCDAIPWVLFGITAKNGAVDEVLSWPGGEVAKGSVTVDLPNGDRIVVTRKRGKGKDNDLYYEREAPSLARLGIMRGKDLNDTQKLINHLLGTDATTYLAGAYFHEFSQTAQFFITNAKNRRIICEQLVDLSLAKKLQTKLAEQKKALNAKEAMYGKHIQVYADRVQQLSRPNDYQEKYKNFEMDKVLQLTWLESEIKATETNIRNKRYFRDSYQVLESAIKSLGSDICKECGSKKHSEKRAELTAMLSEVKREEMANSYNIKMLESLMKDLENTKASKNIFKELIQKTENDLFQAKVSLALEEKDYALVISDLADVELLLEVIDDFRAATIKNTIKAIENKTNQLLTEYFDAEIRVLLSAKDADKIEVEVFKDGNACSYSQLSKGQRQLLKLCFGISVMKAVTNYSGIQFNAIFLDEALDGLDDYFKVRTFRLLEGLAMEYESVFVVEHNEALKSLFPKSYKVGLVDGASTINE